jgi:cobalt-zinc-cadmium efflux system outer membrane protein
MMENAKARTILSIVFMVLAIPFWGLGAQEQEPLRLEGLIEMARVRSPRVRAALEQVEATRAREPGSGLLPDPTFQIGVMNLALPEFSASMPASMAPTFQAMQRFPLAGKLSLREEVARQSTEIDAAASEEVWWEVRTEVATAFYGIYQVDRRIEVLERSLELLQDFEIIARSMYGAGTGRQADVLRANVEVARMEAEIERMKAVRIGSASRLNALVNRPADTPVGPLSLDPFPATVPGQSVLRERAAETRPILAQFQAELDRAGTRKDLAKKDIWPDLTIGLQYGLGRMAGDYKSMGGASVGFSIPLYAGKRQFKARDEAAAIEAMVRARFDNALALVDARVGEVLANLEQARTLIRLYREEILPQARATVESSRSSYRVGAVDFMTLVDAQMGVNRFEGEYFGLLASYGTSIAQLEMTIGRDLPVTDELVVEEE